jgi:predicted ATPase/class 3 adenylate cyclase
MPIFLFSDIEGSTALWQQYGRDMAAALLLHDSILGQTVRDFGGEVIKHTGDGIFAVFGDATALQMALTCALEIQRRLSAQAWGTLGELRVRLALHTGEADYHQQAAWGGEGEDYFGLEVSRTQRLLSAGWGGQILLSAQVAEGALPPGASLRDHGVHLLKDLIEPQHIYELRHPDLPLQTFPALRTLSAHPHNLPPQNTPFVGRSADLAALAEQLARPSCRLLTLIGPGGIGKTRLALQVAAAQIENFRDGVYFIALAPLNSAEQIVPTLAEALRFAFHNREPLLEQLLRYLSGRQLLLVVDNFEHVIEGAEMIGQVLQRAPQVRILVTSRERLNLIEEELYLLHGMALPESPSDPQFETYSAICLFEQALQRSRGLSLQMSEREAALRIGHLVEGVPLAIELACGWARLLSLEEIAAEIERSLDFLQVAQRDRPERHRSLRAAFEYSWRLLEEEDQAGLRRLAVFRGSFDRHAAQQVANCSLPRLAGLMDKSLLRSTRHLDGSLTYDLHPLIRQYAADKLVQNAEESKQVQQRHCDWFAGLAQQVAGGLQGAQQPQALRSLAEHYDDLFLAWNWAFCHRQPQAMQQLGEALVLFWSLRGRCSEGVQHLAPVLAAWPEPGLFRAQLCLWQAQLLFEAGCYDDARPLVEEALAMVEPFQLWHLRAPLLNLLANTAWIRGNYQIAETLFLQSCEQARQVGDRAAELQAMSGLGRHAWSLGQYAQAQQYYELALKQAREVGMPIQVAGLLDNLGVVMRDQQKYELARTYLEESLQCLRSLGIEWRVPFVLNHLGGVLLYLENFDVAEEMLEESIRLGRKVGDLRIVGYSILDRIESGWIRSTLSTAWLEESVQQAHEAIEIFTRIEEPFAISLAWGCMARLRCLLGQRSASIEAILKAISYFEQIEYVQRNPNVWLTITELLSEQQPLAVVELCAALESGLRFSVEETLAWKPPPGLDEEQVQAAQQRGAALDLPGLLMRVRTWLADG